MTDEKNAEEIKDTELDAAQGGYTVELVNATVAGIRSEHQVVEYQDGDDLVLRKRPGKGS